MDYQNYATASGNLGRVLVIDDVAVVRRSIKSILTSAGHEVVEAEDGARAIEILQASESARPVDAILSDLRMPQIDGVELIVYLRTRYPAIPVVALTTYQDVELAVSLMRKGAMDFLVKPVLQDELVAVIGRAVGQNTAGKEQVISYRELRQRAGNELGKSAGG